MMAASIHAGGKTLYTGTHTGCIRAYKLPLTGEHQEHKCFSTAVTRMCLGDDGSLLHATSADGALCVFEVRDRDPTRPTIKRSAQCWQALLHRVDLFPEACP